MNDPNQIRHVFILRPDTPAALIERNIRVTIRAARSEDAAAMLEMHSRLSSTSIYNRYLGPYRPTIKDMQRMAGVHAIEGATFVAVTSGPVQEVIAYACYVRDEQWPQEAEPALLVEDRYQRRGLGSLLFEHLSQHARTHGVQRLKALVHHDNRAMRRVIERSGLHFKAIPDHETVEFRIRLEPVAAFSHGDEAVSNAAGRPRLAGDRA